MTFYAFEGQYYSSLSQRLPSSTHCRESPRQEARVLLRRLRIETGRKAQGTPGLFRLRFHLAVVASIIGQPLRFGTHHH